MHCLKSFCLVLSVVSLSSVSGQRSSDIWSLNGQPYKSVNVISGFCPSGTECVPLTSCPLLNSIMENECVISGRAASLGCGFEGSGLVCCPQVSEPTKVSSGKVDGQQCGSPAVLGDNYDGIGAYPWAVRIGFRNTYSGEMKYPCAGSIINNRVILTTAHCALAKSDNYKLHSVRVGEYNTDSDIDCGEEFCALPTQDIMVNHIVVHPGYEKQTYKHNIALIVLRSKINYTVTAKPICIPEPWSITNDFGIVVGWGKAAGQTEAPHKQQVLYIPIISLQQCVNVYGSTLPVTENQLCAGGERGKDACTGFGGAPLFVRHGNTHYQVGILSFGSDQCGAPGVPSVYTNIKKYVNWIKENSRVYNI